jgi:hypothetical protein
MQLTLVGSVQFISNLYISDGVCETLSRWQSYYSYHNNNLYVNPAHQERFSYTFTTGKYGQNVYLAWANVVRWGCVYWHLIVYL